MVIHEMSRDDCIRLLAGTRLARLGCARQNQPYVVPVYLTYDVLPGGEPCLYGFTTPGQKIEWMRANPLVCVEVDEVTAHDDWVSVVAFGRYEELFEPSGNSHEGLERDKVVQLGRYTGPDAPRSDDQQTVAHQVLRSQAMWWEPACTVAPPAPIAIRSSLSPRCTIAIRLDRVTGHRATPDSRTIDLPAAPARNEGWLSRALRLFAGRSPSE